MTIASNRKVSRAAGGKSDTSGVRARPERKRERRTQAERTAESDARMLGAAVKLIGERGYRGTSLAAIGEAAGYSRGLVHERFGSKDGLLWVLVERMMRDFGREVRAKEAGLVGIDRLCSVVDSHRAALKHHAVVRTFYALMFEALGPIPQLRSEFRRLHDRFRGSIEKMVREGIELGVISADVDPQAQAVLLLGALRGIGFQWLLDPDAFPLDATYEELKRNLRRSLAS